MNVLAVLLAAGVFGASLELASKPRFLRSVPLAECTGCTASEVNDPGQNITGGVQVVSTAPGFTITGSLIIRDHGSCILVWHEQRWQCSAAKNCKYGASYTALDDGTNGPFRNDRIPYCEWSTQMSPGDDEIMTGLTSVFPDWIAACGSPTFQSVQFFKNAADCQGGVLIGEIKFHALCSVCPP